MRTLNITPNKFFKLFFSIIAFFSVYGVNAQLQDGNRILYLRDAVGVNDIFIRNSAGNLDVVPSNQAKNVNFIFNNAAGKMNIGSSTFSGAYKLNVDGVINGNGALIGAKNVGGAYFGNGSLNQNPADFDNYAILQGPTGGTSVNSSAGRELFLKIKNLPKVTVSDNQVEILAALRVTKEGTAADPHFIKGNTVFGNKNLSVANATLTVRGRIHVSDEDATQVEFKTKNAIYQNYLLWVQEGIVTNDLAIAETGSWPDYVFNKEYKLNTINELENFIKTKGHLPTMPSAKEVEDNGFTVSDITKRTVKTIEELTLHTIEQQKLIEKQALLIDALEKRLTSLENK
jgi:hypothetical protein